MAVVDTNVPVTANGDAPQSSPGCRIECVKRIVRLTQHGKVVLDDGWRIIREYKKHLSPKGQPRVGDIFLKWVLTNRTNPHRCVLVSITPVGTDENRFREFPDDPRLAKFDRADRKFVAVACAHPERTTILQALDSKWWPFRDVLEENGVRVTFLCPVEIEAIWRKKTRQRATARRKR